MDVELKYNNHKHLIELSMTFNTSIDRVLNLIIESHMTLSKMSFKDRKRLERLMLKYSVII